MNTIDSARDLSIEWADQMTTIRIRARREDGLVSKKIIGTVRLTDAERVEMKISIPESVKPRLEAACDKAAKLACVILTMGS